MYNPTTFPAPPYHPGGGGNPIQHKANALIGQPAGISLRDGTGVAGVICGVQGGEVYVMQYMYQKQFATFHYPFNQIQDIHPYPNCQPYGPYY